MEQRKVAQVPSGPLERESRLIFLWLCVGAPITAMILMLVIVFMSLCGVTP